jgi:hypothetical protein
LSRRTFSFRSDLSLIHLPPPFLPPPNPIPHSNERATGSLSRAPNCRTPCWFVRHGVGVGVGVFEPTNSSYHNSMTTTSSSVASFVASSLAAPTAFSGRGPHDRPGGGADPEAAYLKRDAGAPTQPPLLNRRRSAERRRAGQGRRHPHDRQRRRRAAGIVPA